MKRVLVCRTGAFGDICMAMPVVHALASQCEVHWLIRRGHTALLRLFPEVKCHPVIFEAGQGGTFPADLIQMLVAAQYDALLDFSNWDIIASLASRVKSIPVRAIAYDDTRMLLYQRLKNALPWFKPFNKVVKIDGKVHRVVKWQELIRASLGYTLSIDWPLPPIRSIEEPVRLLVQPHSSKANKRWSIDNFVTALASVAERKVIHCFINEGHAGERSASEELGSRLRQAGLSATIVPFDASFIALKNALAQAHAAVGSDSGPMHLAALLGVPTVVIYGPYTPVEIAPLWRSVAVTPPGGRGVASDVTPVMVSGAVIDVLS